MPSPEEAHALGTELIRLGSILCLHRGELLHHHLNGTALAMLSAAVHHNNQTPTGFFVSNMEIIRPQAQAMDIQGDLHFSQVGMSLMKVTIQGIP